jgi:hypothetical protein
MKYLFIFLVLSITGGLIMIFQENQNQVFYSSLYLIVATPLNFFSHYKIDPQYLNTLFIGLEGQSYKKEEV